MTGKHANKGYDGRKIRPGDKIISPAHHKTMTAIALQEAGFINGGEPKLGIVTELHHFVLIQPELWARVDP